MTSGGGYTYGYDNNGNTISKTQLSTGDVWSYSYDYENRLTGAVEKSSGGATLEQVTYTYDALGRQIVVDTNSTLRRTVYTGSSADANPYADYTGSGALSMRYLYGLAVDQILARTDPNANTAWYLTDQLGSVWNVVSSSGTVLDAITYDAYGNILSETSSSSGDRFKFAGMQYDSTTGLYYDHARYYDPNTGRFVSQDPKGFAAGDTNLYRYVSNSPTVLTDPSGRGFWSGLAGAVAGGVAGGIAVGIIIVAAPITAPILIGGSVAVTVGVGVAGGALGGGLVGGVTTDDPLTGAVGGGLAGAVTGPAAVGGTLVATGGGVSKLLYMIKKLPLPPLNLGKYSPPEGPEPTPPPPMGPMTPPPPDW